MTATETTNNGHTLKVNVPSHWKVVPLGDVLTDIVGGGTPSKANSSYWKGSIPWLTVKDMRTRRPTDAIDHISEEAAQYSSTNIIPADTVIIATRVGLGKVVRVPYDSAINQDLKALIAGPELDKSYLEYWMTSIADYLESIGSGTTVKGIRLEQLRSIPFPLAPLDEQKVIVAEIEKQFSRLDEAVANLKRVKANLKRYKAAVIRAAVEGKSATEQDNEWEETTIGDVTELVTKGSSPNWQGFEYAEKGIVFVRSQNVGWGNLDLSDVAHLPSSFNSKEKKSVLRTDDVLLNIVGASIGRAAIATKQVDGGNINQAVSVIRPSKEHLLSKFLMYYLLSDKAQKLIHSQKVDVARANYSLDQIKKMQLLLPPLDIQKNIVAEVERRLSTVEEIGAVALSNQTRADNLRQALLKKAFEGQLSH